MPNALTYLKIATMSEEKGCTRLTTGNIFIKRFSVFSLIYVMYILDTNEAEACTVKLLRL